MIDIYFGTKRLSISSAASDAHTITFDPTRKITPEEIEALLEHHSHITLRCDNEQQCHSSIAENFIAVTAAGGIVSNAQNEILMIHRNGRYDLPKGHWEQGESIEECAIREVMEETGVEGITILDKISDTLHAYKMHGRWELKQTHWYAMQSLFNGELTPQTEEGITSAKWMSVDGIEESIKASFPTIKYIIGKYLAMNAI